VPERRFLGVVAWDARSRAAGPLYPHRPGLQVESRRGSRYIQWLARGPGRRLRAFFSCRGITRQAEHRAHRALARAGFADPATATAILRQVQVLTITAALARLDYHTPGAAQAAIANLITSPPSANPRPGTAARTARRPARSTVVQPATGRP
jgi:hypothetical protein